MGGDQHLDSLVWLKEMQCDLIWLTEGSVELQHQALEALDLLSICV